MKTLTKVRLGRVGRRAASQPDDPRAFPSRLADRGRPPPPVSVEAIFNATLTKLQKRREKSFMAPPRDDEERAKYCIHPSSSSGCPRKLAFELLDAPRDQDTVGPRMQRIFDNGHAVHMRLQGLMFDAQRLGVAGVTGVWEDVKLGYDPLCVKGELDQIVELREQHRYVVEYKSANLRTFNSLHPSKPKESWLWQVYLYMQSIGLRAALVVVECKDDQRLKEYYVPWDHKQWAQIERKLDTVLEAVQAQELPPPEPKECHFCPYKGVCPHKGGDSNKVPWDNASRISPTTH